MLHHVNVSGEKKHAAGFWISSGSSVLESSSPAGNTSAGKASGCPHILHFSKAGSTDTHAALVIVLIVLYFFCCLTIKSSRLP